MRKRKKERKRIMTAVRYQAAMVVEPSFVSRERRESREMRDKNRAGKTVNSMNSWPIHTSAVQ